MARGREVMGGRYKPKRWQTIYRRAIRAAYEAKPLFDSGDVIYELWKAGVRKPQGQRVGAMLMKAEGFGEIRRARYRAGRKHREAIWAIRL